jgi:hypothetical protein
MVCFKDSSVLVTRVTEFGGRLLQAVVWLFYTKACQQLVGSYHWLSNWDWLKD